MRSRVSSFGHERLRRDFLVDMPLLKESIHCRDRCGGMTIPTLGQLNLLDPRQARNLFGIRGPDPYMTSDQGISGGLHQLGFEGPKAHRLPNQIDDILNPDVLNNVLGHDRVADPRFKAA